jgi:hypothetical protein
MHPNGPESGLSVEGFRLIAADFPDLKSFEGRVLGYFGKQGIFPLFFGVVFSISFDFF